MHLAPGCAVCGTPAGFAIGPCARRTIILPTETPTYIDLVVVALLRLATTTRILMYYIKNADIAAHIFSYLQIGVHRAL